MAGRQSRRPAKAGPGSSRPPCSLAQAYDALRPQAEAAPAAPAADADISSLIAEEVAELKDTAKQTFYHTPTGLSSSVYVEFRDAGGLGAGGAQVPSSQPQDAHTELSGALWRTHPLAPGSAAPAEGPSPSEVVAHVCREAAATKQAKTRFCNRFYPIDHTVFAGLEKMAELGKALAAEHFPAGAAPIQFAIEFTHRAAPELDRMKVIDAFVDAIPTVRGGCRGPQGLLAARRHAPSTSTASSGGGYEEDDRLAADSDRLAPLLPPAPAAATQGQPHRGDKGGAG